MTTTRSLGQPTAIDVLVGEIDVRAEEISGGVMTTTAKSHSRWWWLGVPLVGAMAYGVRRWSQTRDRG
jgi:hypothetical protein